MQSCQKGIRYDSSSSFEDLLKKMEKDLLRTPPAAHYNEQEQGPEPLGSPGGSGLVGIQGIVASGSQGKHLPSWVKATG